VRVEKSERALPASRNVVEDEAHKPPNYTGTPPTNKIMIAIIFPSGSSWF